MRLAALIGGVDVLNGVALAQKSEATPGYALAFADDTVYRLSKGMASGNVNTQAQSDSFTLTAEKAIDLQSTAANITISAPSKIMLNGGGGYIKIDGGDIEIGTSGQASFKASMKELMGGASASASASELKKASALKGCAKSMQEAAAIGAAV